MSTRRKIIRNKQQGLRPHTSRHPASIAKLMSNAPTFEAPLAIAEPDAATNEGTSEHEAAEIESRPIAGTRRVQAFVEGRHTLSQSPSSPSAEQQALALNFMTSHPGLVRYEHVHARSEPTIYDAGALVTGDPEWTALLRDVPDFVGDPEVVIPLLGPAEATNAATLTSARAETADEPALFAEPDWLDSWSQLLASMQLNEYEHDKNVQRFEVEDESTRFYSEMASSFDGFEPRAPLPRNLSSPHR